MTAVVNDLLQVKTIRDVVSRFDLHNTGIQTILGMQPGGENVTQAQSRKYTVDIFNDNADVAPAVQAGGRSITVAEQPVGFYSVEVPQSVINVPLVYEKLNQYRPLGGPVSTVDALGLKYYEAQLRSVAQRIRNIREFQCAAMLRGSYTYTYSGDALQQNFSGGSVTVNFQIPSGNKTQLDMLGGGSIIDASWATASTDIPGHIGKVSAAFQQLVGTPLTDMIVTSVVWEHIKNNTNVRNQAGSANEPFLDQNRDPATGLIKARIKSHPWVQIWCYDQGLNLGAGGTSNFSKLIADTACVFLARNSNGGRARWQYADYFSPVVESYGGPANNQLGEYFWSMTQPDPASILLYGKMDGIPELIVPKSVAYGTVVF